MLNFSHQTGNESTILLNEFGGIEYFRARMAILLPYVLFSASGVLVGVVGNGLIVGAILANRELRTNPTFILILNLAAADSAISVIVDSFTVVGKWNQKTYKDPDKIYLIW